MAPAAAAAPGAPTEKTVEAQCGGRRRSAGDSPTRTGATRPGRGILTGHSGGRKAHKVLSAPDISELVVRKPEFGFDVPTEDDAGQRR